MAEAFVNDKIKSHKVVIFSYVPCRFCKLAKEVFGKLEEPFEAIELDDREDASEILDVLAKITEGRSLPRVFVDGNFIGGGTDVKEAYDSGKLQQLLKK